MMPYDTICKNCGASIFRHDFMDYTGETDVVDCDDFEKMENTVTLLEQAEEKAAEYFGCSTAKLDTHCIPEHEAFIDAYQIGCKDCQSAMPKWTAEKPDYACVFVGKRGDSYSVWNFVWTQSEGDDVDEEDFHESESTIHYYLIWADADGDDYDDIKECNFDEYLVIAKLPTMEEVHAETIEHMKKRFAKMMESDRDIPTEKVSQSTEGGEEKDA